LCAESGFGRIFEAALLTDALERARSLNAELRSFRIFRVAAGPGVLKVFEKLAVQWRISTEDYLVPESTAFASACADSGGTS